MHSRFGAAPSRHTLHCQAIVQHMSDFSVIIPTLQRADELSAIVAKCASHPRVLEVLVINNAPAPLDWDSPKVRVLQQSENIYVNPAWNLGAREARGKYLAILNDDISFNTSIFEKLIPWLKLPFVGIIGPSLQCFSADADRGLNLRPTLRLPPGFGTAMFMNAKNYTNIPEQIRVYFGDDWLFQAQTGVNFKMTSFAFRTPGSVISSDASFSPIKEEDREWALSHNILEGPYTRRYGRILRLRESRLGIALSRHRST